ncbi:MAG: metallopeptidase TldD-related protein [Pyrobaculum sp.]
MILRLFSNRVDEAALVKVSQKNYMARFANDEVTIFKHWTSESLYLYLARGRRALYVNMSGGLDIQMLEREVRRLSTLPEDPLYVPLGGPTPGVYQEPEGDPERLVDLVKTAVDNTEGVERNAGAARMIYSTVEYEDTAGRTGRYALNKIFLTMRSFAGELSVTNTAAGRQEVDARRLAVANSQLLSLARGLPKRRAEASKTRLLLSPIVFGHLMGEVAMHWVNGGEVIAQTSRYTKEDLGKEVASENLTLVETTYYQHAYGFTPFDFEGIPPRRVGIFDRGVLKEFIHNRRTAARLGVESTGHALGGWVRPSPGHVEVAPGDIPHDVEILMTELRRGYYIHNNWYTRYQNVKTGQFSTVGRDLALEVIDGRPVAVVKFVRIADTLENIVRNIAALSKEAEQVYWWDMVVPATAPYAIIQDVGITT